LQIELNGFGIDVVQDSDKDMNFYTGLSSFAVFDILLEDFNPDERCSNVVYRATTQRWTSDCAGGMQLGEAEWRDKFNASK